MNSVTQQRIRSYIQELIEQANTVASTVRHTDDRVYSWVDSEDQARFRSECRNLIRLLGDAGEVWKDEFASNQNDLTTVTDMRGTLKAIGNAIDKGMLDRIEELAVAEAIGGLMDQADHLLSQNYFLAAGVLGRAALEEHLRKTCDHLGCTPQKPKPTMNDYTDALYAKKHLTLAEKKHVEAMTAVGNDAAHNKPTLKKEDVERMIPDVKRFLAQHPI